MDTPDSLPPCTYRITGPWPRACGCRHPMMALHGPVHVPLSRCLTCPLPGSPRRKLPCIHIGPETDKAPCAGCGGASTVPVRLCGIHGECLEHTELRTNLMHPEAIDESLRARQTKLLKQKACDRCPDKAMIGPAPRNPWAVCCRFNFCGYKKPAENYDRFRAALDSALPLLTIEALRPGHVSEVRGQRLEEERLITVDVGARQFLWQKEALFNLAESQLPDDCDAVFFLDADLVWHEPGWVSHACEQLRNHQAVHLMEWIEYANGARKRSCVPQWLETGKPSGFPGGAWAVRRDWFRAIGGFPALNPLGGGDNTFAWGLCGVARTKQQEGPLYNWAQQIAPQLWHATGPGYLQGVTCTDLPHGKKEHRAYEDRHAWLSHAGFDPDRHLRLASNGLLEWTDAAPDSLVSLVKDYFASRREDE